MLSRLYFIALALVACMSLCIASERARGSGHHHDHHNHHNHHHDHHNHQAHIRHSDNADDVDMTLEQIWNSFDRTPLDDLSSLLAQICPDRAVAADGTSTVEFNLHGADFNKPLIIKERQRKRSWRNRDIEQLVHSPNFNLSQPTLVYMGGWRQSKRRRWLVTARRVHAELIAANGGLSKFNMLLFDWKQYADPRYYPSAALVPHLGKILADFIEQLIRQHNYKADQIHLISFSLSTHIAGLAGRQLQLRKLGHLSQITAIDPTAVCFQAPIANGQYGKRYALRPSDAKLVVARHYDMDLYGARQFIGGIDIVVNGGKEQPKVVEFVTDHSQGAEHERTMTNNWNQSDCSDVAYECESYQKFRKGQCADCDRDGKSCLMISTLANAVQGRELAGEGLKLGVKMYLNTDSRMSCAQTYQIVAKLRTNSSTKVMKMFHKGRVRYNLGARISIKPQHKLTSESGDVSFTSLLLVNRTGVSFYQHLDEKSLEVLGSLESISVNYMSSTSADIRKNKSIRFCPHQLASPKLIRCDAKF